MRMPLDVWSRPWYRLFFFSFFKQNNHVHYVTHIYFVCLFNRKEIHFLSGIRSRISAP